MKSARQKSSQPGAVRPGWIGLCFGYGVSSVGDWIKTVVLIGVMYHLDPSVAALGWLLLASFLPSGVGKWCAWRCGHVWWNLRKRRLFQGWTTKRALLALDVLWAVSTALLVFCVGKHSIWGIDLCVAWLSWLAALYEPLRKTFFFKQFQGQELTHATMANAWVHHIAMIVGSLLGGLLAERMPAQELLYLDAFTFLIAALYVAVMPENSTVFPLMKTKWFAPLPAADSVWRRVCDGLATVKERPRLAQLYILQAWREWCAGLVSVLFLFILLNTWHAGGPLVGLCYALLAAALLVGTVPLHRNEPKRIADVDLLLLIKPLALLYALVIAALFTVHHLLIFLLFLLIAQAFRSGGHALHETLFQNHAQGDAREPLLASWTLLSRFAYGLGIVTALVLGDRVEAIYLGGGALAMRLVVSLVLRKLTHKKASR